MLKRNLVLLPKRRELYQAKLVFYLFLASLAMFFSASLVSYCAIRAMAFRTEHIDFVPLKIPFTFWISTLFLVIVSVAMQLAVSFVRRERQILFRRALMVAGMASLGFMVLQTVGMEQLYHQHFSTLDGSTKSFGICFTLAFLHALHVLGGFVFVGYIGVNAWRDRYDHERHWAVDNCASYWHFLDIVWVLMLVTFLVAR